MLIRGPGVALLAIGLVATCLALSHPPSARADTTDEVDTGSVPSGRPPVALHVDLGGAIALAGARDIFYGTGFERVVVLVGPSGRVFVGDGRFSWGFEVTHVIIDRAIGFWDMAQTDVLTGPAVSIALGPDTLLQPRLFLGLQRRSSDKNNDCAADTEYAICRISPTLQVGVALRIRIGPLVGFVIDPAVGLAKRGPLKLESDYIWQPVSARLVVGVSIGQHGWRVPCEP